MFFPLWVTVTVTSAAALTFDEVIPLMVTVPERSSPVLGLTVTVMEPLPSPEPLSTLIQSAEAATPQLEFEDTLSNFDEASSGSKDNDVGETESVCWTISGSFSLHENACMATMSRQANGYMALLITIGIIGKPEPGQGLRPEKRLEGFHDSLLGLGIVGHLHETCGIEHAIHLVSGDVELGAKNHVELAVVSLAGSGSTEP